MYFHEPIDLDACIWLSEYLASCWQGTLLIVSHDADFLDEVCTDVLQLDDEKLRHYQVSSLRNTGAYFSIF